MMCPLLTQSAATSAVESADMEPTPTANLQQSGQAETSIRAMTSSSFSACNQMLGETSNVPRRDHEAVHDSLGLAGHKTLMNVPLRRADGS